MHEELLMIYYFFRRIYINYGNITWGSTSKLNLKKQAVSKNMPRESYIEEISHNFTHLKYLFREIKVLNVFQLNILNNLVFMHKTIIIKKKPKQEEEEEEEKIQPTPTISQHNLLVPTDKCPTTLHPDTLYHHLNKGSLNTEFQSEAPHYGKQSYL